MLVSLYVKNLALIEETEVEFSPGLNIITGETGAGKSLLLGSINLVLGAKADKDLIRKGTEYALVELCFKEDSVPVRNKLEELELPNEEDVITLTRRITPAKSISRINGETVSAKQLKEIAELLLDIHGQHEHQSLLNKRKHLEILDAYAGDEVLQALSGIKALYLERNRIKAEMEAAEMDEAERKRELELLRFELQEIETAHIQIGEDEELENRYRKMANSQKIGMALNAAYLCTDSDEGAAAGIGRACRELNSVTGYDEDLEPLCGQIAEIEALLNDFNRDLADYISDMEFDEAEFGQTRTRLDQLNHLKEKYGKTLTAVLEYGKQIEEKIEKLLDYESYMESLHNKYGEAEKALYASCEAVSDVRKKYALKLSDMLTDALEELNFLTVAFKVKIERKEVSADGFDDVEFLISTNPGEECKPLVQVASGGELSRIMLGIKTLLADKDAVDTLIFDEIDAGISGKTAWKVSEKLGELSKAHQVLCITHLPQIAAMADTHFVIEKQTDGNTTVTTMEKLTEQGIMEELARLLGSDGLSEAALVNAKDLKGQAAKMKEQPSKIK